MPLHRFLCAVCALILTAGVVAAPAAADDAADAYVAAIEAAHGGDVYAAQQAVAADVTVEFGGQTVLDGAMLFDPAVSTVRLELDGSVIVFDGTDAWLAGADVPRARFHVLTWPYFLAAPFKLDDPGTHVESLGEVPWRGEALPAVELTFGEGVGDSPDDWYVVYRDPKTHRLDGLGYIVTYGTDLEEAEKEPHAISYDGYVEIGGGAWLSTDWSFWLWDREQGVHGDPLGRATLSNVRFTTASADAFTAPAGARKIDKP